jgi:hypothetical protein
MSPQRVAAFDQFLDVRAKSDAEVARLPHSCPPFRDVGAESTCTPFSILSGDSYLTARSEGPLRHVICYHKVRNTVPKTWSMVK